MSPGTNPPGLGDDDPADRLRCGAEVDALLDQVAVGRAAVLDAHQQACPHCRAALAEYDRLWAPVRELAATEVHPPDSLLEDTIRRLRGATSDPDYGTLTGPIGTTRIAARVVVVTARETAQAIAGVRVALSKLVAAGVTPVSDAAIEDFAHDADTETSAASAASAASVASVASASSSAEPRVVAGVAGRSTAIEVTLAAEYGTDLVVLGERIRSEVAARVRDLTGLEPVSVDVRVDDVFT